MSWWSSLFSGGKPQPATGSPAYRDLLEQVADLKATIERERASGASQRRKLASRMADDQTILRRYRSALEFYADLSNWRSKGFAEVLPAVSDRGHKAREALNKV